MRIFYTGEDIEELAASGITQLEVGPGVVLTDLAREMARDLGIQLVAPGETTQGGAPAPSQAEPVVASARPQSNVNSVPQIQLALDYAALPPALAMAQQIYKEVEIIEIGTPLNKAEGMRAVSAVRELCPDNLILADIKSPDVGGLEAKMAFDAGADYMTVLGAAPIDTVKLALEEANSRPGKEMFIELTGIRDILARAREWRNIGVERMVYHRGWDEGNLSRSWDEQDRATIQELINMGFKVSIAGGLGLDMISFFRGVDISVFIIGRAIRETPDPAATARQFRAEINKYWAGGGSYTVPQNNTSAANAAGDDTVNNLVNIVSRLANGGN